MPPRLRAVSPRGSPGLGKSILSAAMMRAARRGRQSGDAATCGKAGHINSTPAGLDPRTIPVLLHCDRHV